MDKKKYITRYRQTLKDPKVIGISILITAFVAWLFYRSYYGLLLYPVILAGCVYYFAKVNADRLREEILIEFREMLKLISSELRSGHSLENAVMSLDKEIINLCGRNAKLLPGIMYMKRQLQLHKPVEQVISEFAAHYDYEEISNFAYTISYVKRLGGNYIVNISNAASKIEKRLEVKNEIKTLLAEKQFEMKIMGVMPLGILLYIGITSYEFIEPLYYNPAGIIVMSVSLIMYVACLYIAKRIVTIDY